MDTSTLIVEFNKRFTLPTRVRSYMSGESVPAVVQRHGDGTFRVDPAAFVAAFNQSWKSAPRKVRDYLPMGTAHGEGRMPRTAASPSLPQASQTPLLSDPKPPTTKQGTLDLQPASQAVKPLSPLPVAQRMTPAKAIPPINPGLPSPPAVGPVLGSTGTTIKPPKGGEMYRTEELPSSAHQPGATAPTPAGFHEPTIKEYIQRGPKGLDKMQANMEKVIKSGKALHAGMGTNEEAVPRAHVTLEHIQEARRRITEANQRAKGNAPELSQGPGGPRAVASRGISELTDVPMGKGLYPTQHPQANPKSAFQQAMGEVQQQINAGRTSGMALPKKPDAKVQAKRIQQPAGDVRDPKTGLVPNKVNQALQQLAPISKDWTAKQHRDKAEWLRKGVDEGRLDREKALHAAAAHQALAMRKEKAAAQPPAAIPPNAPPPRPESQDVHAPPQSAMHPERFKWLANQLRDYPEVFHGDRKLTEEQLKKTTHPAKREDLERQLREYDEVLRQPGLVRRLIGKHSLRDYGAAADREFSKTEVPREAEKLRKQRGYAAEENQPGRFLGEVRGFDVYEVTMDANADDAPEDEVWISEGASGDELRQAILDAVIEKTVARSTSRDPLVETLNKLFREAIAEVRGPEKNYAATDPVQQPPWSDAGDFSGALEKNVKIGNSDYHFVANPVHDYSEHKGLFNRFDLSPPMELEFGSGPWNDTSVNGKGHAGQVLSHANHALHELLREHRPAAVLFSAIKPSRQKAYDHLMRRFNRDTKRTTGGEYLALALPAQEGDSGRRYAIVHRGVRHLPHLRGEPIEGKLEPVRYSTERVFDTARMLDQAVKAYRGSMSPVRYAAGDEVPEPPEEQPGTQEPQPSTGLSPRHLLDIHSLAQTLAKNGGKGTANTLITSGRWREQPPHDENSGHRNRAAEAMANAVTSGALQQHPDTKTLGRPVYAPGPNFERFNRPMENPPKTARVALTEQWREPTEPPSIESAKFIQETGLHPRQLADIQVLTQMMQNEGGRLGAHRIDQLRGKWRSQPPHVKSDEYANRHEEARGLAMKHGVFAPDPESEKYIPGENYSHFLPPGQEAVPSKLEKRHPSARRSAADRKAYPTMPSKQKAEETEPEEPKEPTPKQATDKIWAADRQFVQALGRSFTDEARKKGVELPEDHDWNDLILAAATQRGHEPAPGSGRTVSSLPVGLNDRDEIIARVGHSMIDAIRNYDQSKDGPFDPWFRKTIIDAGRTAVDQFREETRGQKTRITGTTQGPTGRPGNAGPGTWGESGEGEEGHNPFEPTAKPEFTDEARTITPEKAVRVLSNREKWNNPKFVEAREAITDCFGPQIGQIFKDLMLGRISAGELEAQSKRWPAIRDQFANILAGHLGTGIPEDQNALDAMETVLGTERMKKNPLKMSSKTRGGRR